MCGSYENEQTCKHSMARRPLIPWCQLYDFLAVLGFMLFYYQLDPRVLIVSRWFGIPFIALLALISTAVGFGSGYMFGNQLKNGLKADRVYSKVRNGNFAYRIPSLGDDEIGLAADQLNEMAERIERQVASLQSCPMRERNGRIK
ncbi:HAMP domain-containing protein [Bacillus licheniformis]|nr:HAMP domain-containing protein [Bacillus licheniformis]